MTPADLVCGSTLCFLAATLAVILYHTLTGRVSMAGLLFERAPNGSLVYSPARVQLLLATVAGVGIYLSRLNPNTSELPAMDPITLSGIGGSQTLYLASKAWAAYRAVKS